MLKNLLKAQDLSTDLIQKLVLRAKEIRSIHATIEGRKSLKRRLEGYRSTLYFTQASTRTFFSFYNACQILGLSCADLRDHKLSSESKGESELDSLHTLATYTDLLIMRHSSPTLIHEASQHLENYFPDLRWINAGSGSDEHPSQALLDIFTMSEECGGLQALPALKIAFIGDIQRSRTVHSLLETLKLYSPQNIYLIPPEKLQLQSADLKKYSDSLNINCLSSWDSVLNDVDVLYMTRSQDEYGDVKGHPYVLNLEVCKKLKSSARILSPLPRLRELPTEVDSDSRAAYWRQEANGLWIRCALLEEVLLG